MSENVKPDNEEVSNITYQTIKTLSSLKDYKQVLSFLELESEISSALLKGVLKLLEDNKNSFKSKNPLIPILYLMNNIFYIMELTSAQGLDSIIDANVKQYLYQLYEKYTSEYLKLCWGDAADTLNIDIQINLEKDGKLKKSTKKQIKTRYSVIFS
jgi:hypothetical protein